MATSPALTPAYRISFDRAAQVRAVVVGLAFIAVFYNVLLDLSHKWLHEADWSHGPIIPLFSAYLVYLRWDKIKRCPVKYTFVGLVIMLAALLLYQWSLWGITFGSVQPVLMMLCLLGVIIYLCGLPQFRYTWLPWLYLFFAIPLPKRYYFELTNPLRHLAALCASKILALVPSLEIQPAGSLIEFIYNGKYDAVGVADACSGMRSTITLCALGVAVAFMQERPWWHRLIMLGSVIPIAVVCNVIRVTITCALYIFVDPKYAEGTAHMGLGLVMLLIAFLIFQGLGWALEHLFVEEPDEPAPAGNGAPRP